MADQIADIDRQIDALYDDLQESRYLLYGIMVHQVRAWMCVCVCVCVCVASPLGLAIGANPRL